MVCQVIGIVKFLHQTLPNTKTPCFGLQGEDLSGGGNHAAAELQLHLFHHLDKCPNAIVHIQNLVEVHADLLTVLLVALSEQVLTARSASICNIVKTIA